MKRRIGLYGASLLIALIGIEISAYVMGSVLKNMALIYDMPTNLEGYDGYSDFYEEYLADRDDQLGWLPREDAEMDYFQDESGSRFTPAFPDPASNQNCVSLYGDSYTYSSEVDSESAWGNVLSKKLNCRVANFGVGGFGTDQAYLRFMLNVKDESPIVVLNHLSENILRNVAQLRSLMYRTKSGKIVPDFKPRFLLDENGGLKKIDLPTFRPDEFEDVLIRPEDYLPYDYFVPEGESGLVRLSFPFSLSILKVFGHFHVQAWLRNQPWYGPFYEEMHPSQALQVTSLIMQAFHAEALKRGKIPVLTVIPTGQSLRYFRENGVWPYQPLIDSLNLVHLDVLNFGEGIMQRLEEEDPCQLFDNCDAHYNEKGYAMLAEIADEELRRRGVI